MKEAVAIDTNVLSDLLAGILAAAHRILNARRTLRLRLCPAVYAELHAAPGITETALDAMLEDARIIVTPMSEAMWKLSARRYLAYVERRRASGGGQPRRILPDFIIGAHAALCAEALLTSDAKFFQTNFPELKLL